MVLPSSELEKRIHYHRLSDLIHVLPGFKKDFVSHTPQSSGRSFRLPNVKIMVVLRMNYIGPMPHTSRNAPANHQKSIACTQQIQARARGACLQNMARARYSAFSRLHRSTTRHRLLETLSLPILNWTTARCMTTLICQIVLIPHSGDPSPHALARATDR